MRRHDGLHDGFAIVEGLVYMIGCIIVEGLST